MRQAAWPGGAGAAVVGPAAGRPGGLRLRDGARLRRYREYQEFYEGRHFQRPRNGRSNLVLNYARAIVDKGVAYLLGRGIGYSVQADGEGDEDARRRAAVAERLLYDVAWANDAEAVDLQVAQNAAILGDGVYKVVWDPTLDAGRGAPGGVRILSVDPRTFFATWAGDDASTLRRVEVAYSLGPEDLALGGYGLTRAEAEALCGADGAAEVVERWTPTELELRVGQLPTRRGANPYGLIPFVHVPNLPPANESWGVSDLVDVIPINREIDERVSDQADVIRFHADPPIVFRGVTDHGDLAVGPGTVWDIPSDADVKLLEWQGQAIAVGEHIERLYRSLYEVTETPRSAFGDGGRLLSGVALEMELRPIVQRTLRKRVWWTRALRRRCALVLALAARFGEGGAAPAPATGGLGAAGAAGETGAAEQIAADGAAEATDMASTGATVGAMAGAMAEPRVRIVWPPMLPKDDIAEVRNQVALVTAGLRAHRTAMDALGTESPEEELARVLADRATLGESSVVSHQSSGADATSLASDD